jgi:hypothetical protein
MSIRKCESAACRNSTIPSALFQNELYGEGRRVHTDPGKAEHAPRCTICGHGRRAKEANLFKPVI